MNQKFIDLQINLHGKEKAAKWLEEIPKIVDSLKEKWELEIGEEFELSWNYVMSAERKSGEKVVLKIYFPEDKEYTNQLATLKIFNGEGSIKVLENDDTNFAILLEQCIPGKTLSSLNDENKETLIFTDVVKKLWKKPPPNSKFSNIGDDLKDFDWYFKSYEGNKDKSLKDLIIKAWEIYKYLVDTQKDLYLLHADLHHENILSSKRGWLAIDPKGVLGEREFEITAFMRNPIKRAKENLLTRDILLGRLEKISKELPLDKERMIGWAFSQTVLSAIWNLKLKSDRGEYWIKISKELEKLL